MKKVKISNKIYNILKFMTTIALPSIGTLYFTLAQIWDFPYGEQIVGTISAITVFLGVLIGVSSLNYNKGKGE